MSKSRTETADIDEFDVKNLLGMLWSGIWWLVGALALAILGGLLYIMSATPMYESDALIQLQPRDTSGLSGIANSAGGAIGGGLGSVLGLGGGTAQAEIPIITSRSVIGATVRELNLATEVKPTGGGVFGAPDARAHVTTFDIPEAARGQAFELRFSDSTHYELTGPNDKPVLSGQIGQAAEGRLASGQAVKIKVTSVSAGSFPAGFKLVKHSWLSTVNGLHKDLVVQEVATGSNVVSLTYQGEDQQRVAKIVNSLAHNYVQQTIEARSKDAKQSLAFLNKQLPKMHQKLEAAEKRLAKYQTKNQPVDMSSQAGALLSQSSNLADKRSQIKLKIAQLKQSYTAKAPEVEAARRQLRQLSQQENELQSKIDKLPNKQQRLLGLQTEVNVQTQLYTALLNRVQQLRLLKAGSSGNVRIVDPAEVPLGTVAPRPKLDLFIAILLGLMAGIAIVLLRIAFRRGLANTSLIERYSGAPVLATIPGALGGSTKTASGALFKSGASANNATSAAAVDSLRRVRTRLSSMMAARQTSVVLVSSLSHGVGAPWVTQNLATLFARLDKSVVVIDADMRQGRLSHGSKDASSGPGLYEYLQGDAELANCLQPMDGSNVQILRAGTLSGDGSDLLMRSGFAELVAELEKRYDLVLVQAPSALDSDDSMAVATVLGDAVSLMVVGTARHPASDLAAVSEDLERQNTPIDGIVVTAPKLKQRPALVGRKRAAPVA